MSTSRHIAPPVAAVAVVVALATGGVGGAAIATAATPSQPSASASASPSAARLGGLSGGWRMTSLETGDGGALQEVPYSGQIVFDPSGRVAVQAMNPDRSAADTQFTVRGYEAWAGRVTLDEAAGTFTARVDSSVARAMIGTDQVRRFVVTGNRLVLTPADGSGAFRATYERY